MTAWYSAVPVALSLSTNGSRQRSAQSLLWDRPERVMPYPLAHRPCHRCPFHVTYTTDSSCVFSFLALCQTTSFLVFPFTLLGLSEMYWALRRPRQPRSKQPL